MQDVIATSRNKTFLFILLILVVPFMLTYMAWEITSENIEELRYSKFETLATESEQALITRMNSYKQALLGGKGFYEGSESVTRAEWASYVDATDIIYNFPGINGIGTIYDVKNEDMESFVQQAREDGFPDFEVHPKGNHPENFIIEFIEPLDINFEAVGLNIGFEAHRREAAILSRDTGKAAITKRILLVQDAEKTPGFLLLLPNYQEGMPIGTPEARRKAFKRWIYAPFIGKNFMRGLTESQGSTLNLRVYDLGKESKDTLIYDSDADTIDKHVPRYTIKKEINVMQQKWLLVWTSTHAFERLEESNEPLLILLAGLMFTGLFGVFVIIMMIRSSDETQENTFYTIATPAMVFIVTILLAYYLQNEIVNKESRYITNATREAADSIGEMISQGVKSEILALGRMAERWNKRGGIPQDEWRNDAKFQVADHPGVKVVEWVDNTYHVRWVEPEKGNENAIGLNIVFNEEREQALKGAEQRKSETVTPPLDLVQGYKAVIAYFPVFVQDKFNGFIVGIFGIEDLIKGTLSGASRSDFSAELIYEDETFFSSDDNVRPSKKDWVATKKIKISDKEWRLVVYPKPYFIAEHTSLLPDLIIAFGFILGVMIALIISFAQRSRMKSGLLSEKENLLSTFVERVPAAVAMFDTNLNYILASNRWHKDYGLEGKEIIGKNHYDIFPEIPKNHPEWLEIHQRVINGEIIRVDEEMFVREDGGKEWLRYELRPWQHSPTEPGGIIMFTENITERKLMDVMKDEFISTVNHELRTPLTSIQGSLGLLKAKVSKDLDEKGRRLLNLSYDNCVRLANLVNDILDMEKIAAGKMEYIIEEVEMCGLVKKVVEQHQSYADKHDITLEIESNLKQVYCKVDEGRFNQALDNLLSNASKFSPSGEKVSIKIFKKNSNTVCIAVEDKGPGIPDSFKDKVFGKFEQADGSTTRAKGGTGLGLNITKSIIEAFGGSVSFDSKVGVGSTFYFVLSAKKMK